MDALSDPLVETVVLMTSSQIGKTEVLNNAVGYYIDQDPAPILVVQPTLEMGMAWSKDRLAPMLRDTPALRGKVSDIRTRDSENTILHKRYKGGHITISGANSPASLASRPIRVVLCDEVDRYPQSAGAEGDPVNLAFKRSTTFWNRKKVLVSSPTVKGISRIEMAYEESDKRRYYVPCPHCGHYQPLMWGQVHWPRNEAHRAEYECSGCHAAITDADKIKILKEGEWRAEKEFRGTAGFHLNELYSPWTTFSSIAQGFLEAKKSPETLRTFINTSLAECWEEGGEVIDDNSLFSRRERYGPVVPMDAAILTAGIDCQDDRLECEIVAWGEAEESWSMEYKVFHGDPARPDVWNDLDAFLGQTWEHESGVHLRVACACIDTGGHHTSDAYAFVKPRQARRIYAVKGSSIAGSPLVSRPSVNNTGQVKLFMIGVDTAKSSVYARMKIEEPGPGYMHFPFHYDEEYFAQLTAEKIVTRFRHGHPYREWVKTRPRNDALDCRVYAMAALAITGANLGKLLEHIREYQKHGVPSVQSGPHTRRAMVPSAEREFKAPSWLERRREW